MENRTERIKFWLTNKELKQIDRKAKKLGMNRSEYIRYLIANCKLVHTPDIDYESYYNRLKFISDEINTHLIFLNQTGTLDEPKFHKPCEEAVETAKQLSDELTEKLDVEIEKAKIKTLRQKLSECGQCERDRETFTSAIRRFMRMDSLTAPLLRELIDHIDVFETEGAGKSRTQRIVVYYRFVGYVEIPDVSQRTRIKADTRKGVAVEYLTEPLPA